MSQELSPSNDPEVESDNIPQGKKPKIDRRKISSKLNIKKAHEAKKQVTAHKKLVKAMELAHEATKPNEDSSSESGSEEEFHLDLQPIKKKRGPKPKKQPEPSHEESDMNPYPPEYPVEKPAKASKPTPPPKAPDAELMDMKNVLRQLAEQQAKKLVKDKKRRAKAREEKAKAKLMETLPNFPKFPVMPQQPKQQHPQQMVPDFIQNKIDMFKRALDSQ